jgi:hypothetical protein
MRSAAFKLICRFLVASLMLMSFTTAHAGMIGVDQLGAAGSSVQLDRLALSNLVSRADVASQLQAQGVDAQLAQSRIAAMSDAEVQALNGQIAALPAGASSNAGWIAGVIIIAVIIWWVWMR